MYIDDFVWLPDILEKLGLKRQTDTGRFLIIFFIRKTGTTALILSAREMNAKEKQSHAKK